MAVSEKRKNLRRTISYPAWIDLGSGAPPVAATLCDASQEGAQILIADAEKLPDRFVLALSLDGAASRHCQVVWRSGNQVGVRFLTTRKRVQQLVPRFDLPLPSEPDLAAAGGEGETDIAIRPPR